MDSGGLTSGFWSGEEYREGKSMDSDSVLVSVDSGMERCPWVRTVKKEEGRRRGVHAALMERKWKGSVGWKDRRSD